MREEKSKSARPKMSETRYEDLVHELDAVCTELSKRSVGVEEEPLRQNALGIARTMSKKICTPFEFATAQAMGILELAGVVAAEDLGIFAILLANKDEGGMTTTEIAKCTRGDHLLVQRILRFLAAHRVVDQVDPEVYIANDITKEYTTNDYWMSYMRLSLDCAPAYAALPKFLRKNEFKNPTAVKPSAWQLGHSTEETFWEWFQARPESGHHFNNAMRIPRSAFSESLTDTYPFDSLFEGSSAEEVVFVDVGGGLGHQSLELRKRFGKERGRIILQDLPHVVEGKDLTDVEVHVHDMMETQPIVGARAYYFRGVCHDHSDEVCKKFLGQIKKVMNDHSRLLIHEFLLKDVYPSENVTRSDLMMMAMLGAMERSESQMKRLLEQVGFKVHGVHASRLSDWVITEASL